MAINRHYLFDLPAGLHEQYIFSKPSLTDNSLIEIIKLASKKCVSSSFETQKRRLKQYKNELLRRLLQHIVYGEQKEAELIIKAFPRLLLEKASVVDYSGRRLKGTALQLALSCMDLAIIGENRKSYPEMCDMITSYFFDPATGKDKLVDGKRLAQEQFIQQFPDEEFESKTIPDKLIKLIDDIINEIESDKFELLLLKTKRYNPCRKNISLLVNRETEIAIQDLRDYLQSKEEIVQGVCFNMNSFLYVLDRYAAKCNGWNLEQQQAFSSKVIGFFERCLPTNFAQIVCQGLAEFIYQQVELERILVINNELARNNEDDNLKYFPLSVNAGLGFDFCIEPNLGKSTVLNCVNYYRDLFQNLHDEKVSTLSEFKKFIFEPKKPEIEEVSKVSICRIC